MRSAPWRVAVQHLPGRACHAGGPSLRLPASHSPAWVLAETATTAVFSLLSMLAIGRVIGPEAAGTGMIAIAAFALLDIIGSTLFPDSLVQRPGVQPRHVASALKVAVLVGIGTGLVLAASGTLLAGWTGVPLVAALCLALAPLLPLSAFAGAASGPVLREQRFAVLACRVLIGQPLALGVGLWMAATGWGAWAMIGNQAAATLTAFLVLLLAGRLPLRPPATRAALAELWPVALPQMAAIMVMMGRYRLFLLALGLIASEAVLACRVLIGQPLALGVGLWMAATGWGAWAMIGNQAAATLTAFLVLLLAGRLPLRPPVTRAALAELWPVAVPQMAAIMVMMGRYRLFLLALGLIASEAVLAVSHFAFRMLDAAVMVVAQTTGRIALPRLCALQGDRDAQAEAFGDLAQLQALLGMPLAAGIALTAPDLVAVVLGPAWAGAGQAAQIVGCAALFGFIHGEPFSLFVARGRARWNLIINAVALAVPLVALLLLQPTTPSEAAFAWAAQSLLLPPLFTWLVLREMRRPLSWLLARIAPAIVATAAMAAVVVTMQQALGLGPAAELAASAATGLATYTIAAFALLRGRPPRALRRQVALA